MVRARRALLRNVIFFFEQEMMGLFRWGTDTTIMPAEPSTARDERRPDRENVFGKDAERVKVIFGRYTLTVSSPNEVPPLGEVVLSGGVEIKGPLDHTTWKRIGESIRAMESEHEYKRPERSGADPIPGWGTHL